MNRTVFFLIGFCLSVLSITGQATVTFSLNQLPSDHAQKVGIRGNASPLSWDTSIPLQMENGSYTVTLNFEEITDEVAFKFVLYTNDDNPTWESIQNRIINLVQGQNAVSTNNWNKEQVIDPSSLDLIPAAKLLEDFELISKMVLEVHPGTYRYNSKEEIDLALDELKYKFSQPLSYQEAYLAISKLTATLRCDHTKAGFNNQSKIINSILHYQKDKLPFNFKWVGDDMIVTHNVSDNLLLERGTKVLCINNVAVLEVRDTMLHYIGADGNTNNNRIYKTEVNGYDFRYNAFDVFYPLLFPSIDNEVELQIQKHGHANIDTIKVRKVTRDERSKLLSERFVDFPKSRDDMWKFEIISDSIAFLTLNSFGLNGWEAMTIDNKKFLSDAFKEIDKRKINNLVIDIRENTGGNDEMSKELFKYLVAETMDFDREGRSRYLKFPDVLKPHIQTWGDNPWYYNLSPDDNAPTDGYYVFKEHFIAPKAKSTFNIYKGNVYLISSAANTSLAFYTVARFRLQEMGIIVGQETGGSLNDVNGGQILFLRLPNTNIEVDFPVMGGFTSTNQPDRGIMPDVPVSYDIDDIVRGRDVEVEAILRMISEKGATYNNR